MFNDCSLYDINFPKTQLGEIVDNVQLFCIYWYDIKVYAERAMLEFPTIENFLLWKL